jgi:pimeloyl-ACP methyl ester carboxylesterase
MAKQGMVKTLYYKKEPVIISDEGKGRAIVFLHGFLESLDIWKHYSKVLSAYYRVVCINLPGHGGTGCLGYIHTMDQMSECVQSVLRQLRIKKSILIGHSMGGYVAMAYAENYPDNVKGICLFNSSAAADNEVKKAERDRVIALVKESKKDLIKNLIPNLFAKQNRKKFNPEIKALKKTARKMSKQGIIAALEGMKERREREIILRFSTYPILFIIGKEDPVVPFEKIIVQTELPRNSSILVLEDAAHMCFLEAYEETLQAIEVFARKAYVKEYVLGKKKTAKSQKITANRVI